MNGTIALHCVGGGITETPPVATLVVYKDEAGYGMKVSGDNPVYVQSVKEGGAAERAGLSPGDKIIKVNGVNVTQSTHIEVVELIKSSVQVVLTVQQKSHNMSSGFSSSQHHRPTSLSANSNTISSAAITLQHRVSTGPTCTERITGPQPVDLEKRRQLDAERVKTLQLMLEVEQSNVDKLRSELAKLASQANSGNANNLVAKQAELSTAERRLKKLQEPLDRQLCAMVSSHNSSLSSGGGSCCDSETPPPLPSRKSLSTLSQSPPPLPPRPSPNNSLSSSINSPHMVFDQGRSYLTAASGSHNFFTQAVTSSPLSGKHQRAKSSPEQLGNVSPAEASRRLIASESMGELVVGQSRTPTSPSTHQHPLGHHHQQQHHYHHQQHQHYHHRHSGIDLDDPCCGGSGFRTPPGTPPPPYPAPILAEVSSSTLNEGVTDNFSMTSSSRSMQSSLDASTPGLGMIQQPIMSMEDDDMSDQEVGQLEDHGPFKSLSKLWKHHAHLAVFMNYVLSNWDPSSLLFYLITDQYKEGNAKEMRKWAYEIHSSFLVPGAPLRLNNVDENVAREIDDVLLKESDKEEILRKIFWKARVRAKEELNEQLADFQLKRTAGLGMLFGPKDALLDESSTDKRKEVEIIEKFLVPKMETYSEDIEKENIDQNVDQRKFITACSLATVLTKVFNVRPGSVDRVPTFVAKDKSNIKARLSNAKARKMALKGHHFVAHQYFTVTYCNHCQFIIGGIGPQGYQCGNCQLNVHRQCVRIVDESCPGPLVRKEKGNDRISKLMERIRPEKKPPSHHQNQMHHNERSKRGEDELSPLGDGENDPGLVGRAYNLLQAGPPASIIMHSWLSGSLELKQPKQMLDFQWTLLDDGEVQDEDSDTEIKKGHEEIREIELRSRLYLEKIVKQKLVNSKLNRVVSYGEYLGRSTDMLELQSPSSNRGFLDSLKLSETDSPSQQQPEDEDSSPPDTPVCSSTPASSRQGRFGRSRILLNRKFKAKALRSTTTHRDKNNSSGSGSALSNAAVKGSSAIARVWDTIATVRWSNRSPGSSGKRGGELIARIEKELKRDNSDTTDSPAYTKEDDRFKGDHRGFGSASGCAGSAATSSATGSGSRSSIGGCGIGAIGSGAGCGAASANELRRVSGFDHADSMDDPSSREDISEMVQQNISSKPKTSNINRSESYKERIHNKRHLREKRKTSDPNLSKTNDCDGSGAFPGNSAGSSSNSSLSTRSLDSPSMSLEQVHPSASASWDSDVDVEADPPDWSQSVSEEVLASLSNTEKKRQEVVNELFHTERSHVRALKVLSQVFHRPLLEAQVLPADQLQLLFSNLDEMVQLHSQFNQAMKRKRKENPCVGDIGDLLLDMFDGEAGEVFERAASTFCSKQQVALNALREQRRKDPKLNTILNDIEANPLCRRLQLKDHILTGMLRLTKYPLLFDNLAKYTAEQNEKERTAVLRCLARSREILRSVNQKVKESEDHHRLAEIQRMIDRSAFDKVEHPCVQEFKNLDITKRRLIHEGVLLWRTVTKKPVELHVVLMDDTILLLHKSDDDRLALKFISHMNSVLSPIVRVSTALVRHNAVDKNSLYLVNTSQNGAQIYELVAPSQEERKLWYKHINEAAEALKEKNDKRMTTSSSSNDLGESAEDNLLPETPFKESSNNEASHANKKETEPEKRKEPSTVEPAKTNDSNLQQSSSESVDSASVVSPDNTTTTENKSAAQDAEDHKKKQTESEDSNVHQPSGVESLRLVTCTQCSLIDPVEVHVEERPVHVAEPVLTPIESLRRLDETVKKALLDKQNIISNILHGSKKNDAEYADDSIKNDVTEPQELIVSAIEQTNRLVTMVNSALTLSETETVLASQSSSSAGINAAASCEATGCPTPRLHSRTNLEPSIPVSKIQPICATIASQLVQLLDIIKDRDEERERLRKELRRSRERLHAIDAEVQRRETTDESNVTSELSLKNEQNISDEINDQIVRSDCSDGPNQDTSVDTENVTVSSQQSPLVTNTEPTDNPKQSLALKNSKEAIDSNVSGPI